MSEDKISFEAEDLGKLEPGKVFISAPSLNDVLQVNAQRPDGKVPLDITIGDGDVVIKRVDERPIQVALIGNFFDNHEELSHRVFYKPQPEVHFTRVNETDWQIVDGRDVIDGSFRIGIFADVISLYALQNQGRQKLRRELTQQLYELLVERRDTLENQDALAPLPLDK